MSLVFVHFWEYNSQTSVYLKFEPVYAVCVIQTRRRRRERERERINFFYAAPPSPNQTRITRSRISLLPRSNVIAGTTTNPLPRYNLFYGRQNVAQRIVYNIVRYDITATTQYIIPRYRFIRVFFFYAPRAYTRVILL